MGNYTGARVETEEITVCRPLAICWGAIFAGWFVATATAILMYVLGTAIGITAIDLSNAEALSEKVAAVSLIWVALSWLVSLYLGSYFAASLGRNSIYHCGKKEGIAVWAFSTVLTVLVGVTGLGITGATGVLATAEAGKAAAPYIAKAAEANEGFPIPANYQVNLKDTISEIMGARTDATTSNQTRIHPRTYGMVSLELLYGDESEAKRILDMHTNLSRAEINTVVSKMAQQTEEFKAKAKAAAEKVARYTAFAMGAAFWINLLSLFAAIAGGKAGKRRYFIDQPRAPEAAL